MDPITDAALATSVARLGKKLYEIGKSLKDRDIKKQVDDVADELRALKQQASELEDENHELKKKLQFNGEDFDFRNPFYYEKTHSETPLCAKCFAAEKRGP